MNNYGKRIISSITKILFYAFFFQFREYIANDEEKIASFS